MSEQGYRIDFTAEEVEDFNRECFTNMTEVDGWFEFDATGNLIDEEHSLACEHDNQTEWARFVAFLQEKVRPDHAAMRR